MAIKKQVDIAIRIYAITAFSLGKHTHLGAQMLLAPLEEQPRLSALAAKIGNQLGFEGKVVGPKHQMFSGIVPDHHPAHRHAVISARLIGCQHAGLG